MEFRQARRTNAKPLIGMYSESGAGKTYSALLLARGFVGPNGRIAMIETESGRGEAYADPVEYPEIGGYDVLPLHDSFAPSIYGVSIEKAEKAKYDALIIDSASHEWEGVGGVLSMAADNEMGGSKGQLIWQKPKIEHQRHFMLRFMQTNIPLVILCMRAKYPMVQTINDKGKKEWTRSDKLEPKQSDDILYEMFVHGWIDAAHKFHRTKSTAKALEPVFLDNEAITLETGAKLAAWARGDAGDAHETALLSEAQNAAEGGLEALRAYWTALGKSDRATLKSQANRLKVIAEKADADDIDPILGDTAPAQPHEGVSEPVAADASKPESEAPAPAAEANADDSADRAELQGYIAALDSIETLIKLREIDEEVKAWFGNMTEPKSALRGEWSAAKLARERILTTRKTGK